MSSILDAIDQLDRRGATIWPIANSWAAEWGNAYVVLHPNGDVADEQGVVLWSWHDDGWADDVMDVMQEQL